MSTNTKKGQPLPSVPEGMNVPFYYSSLYNCGVFYEVPPERVMPYLKGTQLAPAIFDGLAVVSFNYQLYTGQFNSGASITQEVEFSILVYPESQADLIPEISFNDYMKGEDQTKLFGNLRVHVPCDSEIAIKAGMELYGEPKFKTNFKIDIPSLNADPVGTTWTFSTLDPDNSDEDIFTCTVETQNLIATPANFSAITEYGKHDGELIACRWNILQPMDTYFFDSNQQKRVVLTYGNSNHQMKKDMETLIGDTPASAARTYSSAPVAVNSRAYFPIIIKKK